MAKNERQVVVTGLGPVASIGVGADAFWSALVAGRTRTLDRTLPLDIAEIVTLPVASMPPDDEIPGLATHAARLAGMDLPGYRDLAYTLLAIELALADAKLKTERDGNRVGMVQAFEAPGVEATVSHLFGAFSAPPPTGGPPKLYEAFAPKFYAMQPFLYTHVVAKAFGLHGFCTNVHNACSSGAFALETAAQAIRAGHADVMLVVGGEAFDTAVRLEWFRKLDLYARGPEMRPFDPAGTGFFVGEGAAAIVLESAAHAAARGAPGYAAYLGGAFSHQAWKQTIPDIRAGRLATVIDEALARTGVGPDGLDLVVPHGAATALSDGYERECLAKGLGDRASGAVLTAFKPQVGHMLAASGVIELIGALLAMKHQIVPATLHARPDRADLVVPIVAKPTARRVETLLKLSTGFTGHDAAALFRRGIANSE